MAEAAQILSGEEVARKRLEGLIKRAAAGRPLSRLDREQLREHYGGRLPWEVERGAPTVGPAVELEPGPGRVVAATPAILLDGLRLGNAVSGPIGAPGEGGDIFAAAAEARALAELKRSPEWEMIASITRACLMERPSVPVWQWAAQNVFLDSLSTSEPGFYDPEKTPWAKEWQELPLRDHVREAYVMKSSRAGGTEAGLNIIRWMPGHWPGNAGIAFPGDDQARDVVRRRLLESLRKICPEFLTGDAHDEGLSAINLLNMAIRAGGSGSPRLFTEWWVRFWLIDEVEEHEVSDTTSTIARALSRQADVIDALAFVLSKPKKRFGPIHLGYLKGTQKSFLVPCPRCERRFKFVRSGFRYEDFRRADGSLNLDSVMEGTWYECPHCTGRIDQKEKPEMNKAGLWVPAAPADRMRGFGGQYVPAMPGVESYHISDYYSLHYKVAWGALMAQCVTAFEINPSVKDQTHYINNHEGEPEEPLEITLDAESIARLKAGVEEEFEFVDDAGVKQRGKKTLGLPGGYRLAYKSGQINARLPFKPVVLLLFADKQKDCIKFLVYAVTVKPEIGAYLVDLGRVDDENALFDDLLHRDYWLEGEEEPIRITAGFMDSRWRGQAVFNFCLRAFQELGLQIWPVRGEGHKEAKQRGKAAQAEGQKETHSRATRGRIMRKIEDSCELGRLVVRYFKDYDLQMELSVTKIKNRAGWRIWLPVDYPESFASEMVAEYYDGETDSFVHNLAKSGPNDWRDCTKFLVLWMLENLRALVAEHGGDVAALGVDLGAEEEPEEKRGREYVLKR